MHLNKMGATVGGGKTFVVVLVASGSAMLQGRVCAHPAGPAPSEWFFCNGCIGSFSAQPEVPSRPQPWGLGSPAAAMRTFGGPRSRYFSGPGSLGPTERGFRHVPGIRNMKTVLLQQKRIVCQVQSKFSVGGVFTKASIQCGQHIRPQLQHKLS